MLAQTAEPERSVATTNKTVTAVVPNATHRALSAAARAVAPVLFFGVASATYLLAALHASQSAPLWSDEVLAVWVARLPNVDAITQAIWNGAEFSPPTFDILLHLVFRWFGSSPLVARLPSIVAIFVTAASIGWIVRPRLGALAAALAFGLVLNSPLFDFAVQARPYGILMALVAVTLLLWSDYARGWWRPALIGGLLFAGISLHVYAIVIVASFALMEGLASVRSQTIRPAIWLAFAGTGLASLVWFPLVRHLAAFNAGDTAAPAFYGAPTLRHLVDHFDTLFRGSVAFGLFLLAMVLMVALACAAASLGPTKPRRDRNEAGEAEIAIMATPLVASLPIGFLLALVATHVFSARYALPATLGAILLMVLGLSRVPFPRVVGVALCVVLAVLPLLRAVPSSDAAQAIAIVGDRPGPVVVSDSNLFIELMEAAPPALRDRLVHLTKPAAVTDGDTSADHQLQRLVASFRPDLPVREPAPFMAAHARFTEICRAGRATDAFCAWLVAQGHVDGIVGFGAPVTLLTIAARSHAERP